MTESETGRPTADGGRGGGQVSADAQELELEQARGWDFGPVTIWIGRNRNALRIGILVAAFLVLLLWSQPTAWVVLGLALIVGLLHLLVEVLGRAPPARTGNDAGSPAGRVP